MCHSLVRSELCGAIGFRLLLHTFSPRLYSDVSSNKEKDKFTIFAVASVWMMIMVVVYTNLSIVPFWFVIIMNIFFMMGIMSRMVPAMAMVTALPKLQDRGAFMSVNSSLQQIAGGLAAAVGGMIVKQKTNFSPLEHYNTLGYLIVVLSIICVFMVYRVSRMIKAQQKEKTGAAKQPVPLIE